jgi:hypothetical protein
MIERNLSNTWKWSIWRWLREGLPGMKKVFIG